ncbi:MAG: hypothetical protein KME13_11845 [Myxacorys californica WJT36-NPBG1]|jgi:hypothetical protein|nr:hypothetical protein [Myxacorys californica WJT36-NPBG1]
MVTEDNSSSSKPSTNKPLISPNLPTTNISLPPANWNLFDAAVKLQVMTRDEAMAPLVKQITLRPKAPVPPSSHRFDLFDAAAQAKAPDRSLLTPFAQLVEKLTDYEKQIGTPKLGCVMTIEQLTVDMPIELKVTVNPDGTVQVKGSPPTQLVNTTVMPVWHQMRLRIVREDDE